MKTPQLFGSGPLSVRTMVEADAPLMARWLSDPAVLQYYEGRDHPFDLTRVIDKFFGPEHEDVTPCIVSYESADIGYLQFYPLEAWPEVLKEYGYPPDANVWGIDLFIGETDCWNRGIGTGLVKATVHYLQATFQPDHIVIDPHVWNLRAVRCYEKSGFHIVKLLPEHELHEGKHRDCWLMEYRPTANPRVAGTD